ncbi:MAG: DUF4351 domain-containing protein [Clostridium sp.]
MENSKEKVKLDQILKFLFTTSDKVLVKLLNGVFEENFKEDEVVIKVTNNEFIEDTLGILRGDMFFEPVEKNSGINSSKVNYHLEFQTKNDSSMVIRMFEYGFQKAKENSEKSDGIRTMYFPKQRVIFFEENKNINGDLVLNLIFPDGNKIEYVVPIMRYWDYTDEDLIKKKMYPLIPLQLFGLKKELEKAAKQNDIKTIKELSHKARDLASKLAGESKELLDKNEIVGEDFHKMLLAIQNLIEYLSRNYMNDDEELEEEVIKMTKTLYDPEVEKRGIQKGEQIALVKSTVKLLKKKFGEVPEELIQIIRNLPIDKVENINDDILDIQSLEEINSYLSDV